MEWEFVDKDRGIERTKVVGGWIVMCHTMQFVEALVPVEGKIIGQKVAEKRQRPLNAMLSICYVPDLNHEWKIDISNQPPNPEPCQEKSGLKLL